MPSFLDLNNISYAALDGAIDNKIDCYPLMFHPLTKIECISFLCSEWSKKENRADPIKFTDQQLALLTLLMNNKHLIIPKHRGSGETLMTSIYLAWEAYYDYKSIIIVAPSRDIGCEILKKIKFMLEAIMFRNNMGRIGGYMQKFHSVSHTKIALTPNKSISVISRHDEFISKQADIIYFSNAAFLFHGPTMYQNALMTLRGGNGQIIMSSASNGEDSLFHRLLVDNTSSNTFVKFPMINPELPPNDPDNWPFR